jgi:hypothetical protein
MIRKFRKVSDELYRGSAPSVSDLTLLKKMGIKKIVSLDEDSGRRIERATKLLGIKHVMLPINIARKTTLIKFLNQDIPKLFDTDGPTFVHCAEGKDRTGLAVAIYRCEEQGWSCGKAIKEAKSLGFGVGVHPAVVKLYKKLIKKACGCKEKDMHDVSYAYDIVSNEREYPSSYSSYTSDSWEQGSWSPYEDYRVREFPYAKQEIDWPEQYQSRQDFGLDDTTEDSSKDYGEGFPQAGGWDSSTSGIMGAGPSLVGSGYI